MGVDRFLTGTRLVILRFTFFGGFRDHIQDRLVNVEYHEDETRQPALKALRLVPQLDVERNGILVQSLDALIASCPEESDGCRQAPGWRKTRHSDSPYAQSIQILLPPGWHVLGRTSIYLPEMKLKKVSLPV